MLLALGICLTDKIPDFHTCPSEPGAVHILITITSGIIAIEETAITHPTPENSPNRKIRM